MSDVARDRAELLGSHRERGRRPHVAPAHVVRSDAPMRQYDTAANLVCLDAPVPLVTESKVQVLAYDRRLGPPAWLLAELGGAR